MIEIPKFNFITLNLLYGAFIFFVFIMAYNIGKIKEYKSFYKRLLKKSDEEIMSLIKTLRMIK